ncbi:MAG: hypothetical protein IT350_17605, partial [Deltaproteobacteria bacterium]|nr:hypothetical protein [Deltaproteobacteria bacterium]
MAKSDDDSSDDDADDDAGTTTTTSPTTTTGPSTSSTTTVVPTSSTTTTIPGSGTACDPFRYTAVDGPDVPDFGPWPEYTIGAITYRQYISGSAGVGRNAVALDADGRTWVFGMVGRSFDAYVFDDDGSVEREIVDPAGGANSEIFRDANGAFHVVYINTNRNEIRYATNAGGEWTQTLLLSVPEAGLDIGAARAADGTLHVVYSCLESDDTGVQYLKWKNGILAEESIRDPDGENGFWSPSVALDSANRPHVAYSGELGIRVAARSDSGWDELVSYDGRGDTEILIDENDAIHIAYGGDPLGLHVADNAGGTWFTSAVDT